MNRTNIIVADFILDLKEKKKEETIYKELWEKQGLQFFVLA